MDTPVNYQLMLLCQPHYHIAHTGGLSKVNDFMSTMDAD